MNMVHFTPCTKLITSEKTTKFFLDHDVNIMVFLKISFFIMGFSLHPSFGNNFLNFYTNRNQPKCNRSIYNYMWLDLGIFATTRPNFNYFGHSHNYDATIRNFILLVGLILNLFSSINRLICLISCNSHQINCILKVFYNDIGVYFNVCTIYIYIYIYV
jgi:hypothetical protein